MLQNWRAKSRTLLCLIVAVVVGWQLHSMGWPWWAWLPAALLSIIGFYAVSVLTWFAYRKLTYQYFARLHKRQRQGRRPERAQG